MRLLSSIVLTAIAMFTWVGPRACAQEDRPNSGAPLTAQQVAARMEERGRERALALREFEAFRVYHLEYQGFGGNKEAEMTVRMTYRAPATKTFTVISQSGSSFIVDHVFKRLLQSEQEALEDQNRQATALTLENYQFSLAGYEGGPDGTHTYILDVKPRNKNKFLYEGRIWVNGEDFGVTRIAAMPARNPSFWIKRTQIEHIYTKIGDFWLPAQNRSESQIRLGGHALLTIDYNNYRVNATTPQDARDSADASAIPNSHPAKKHGRANRSRQLGTSDAALADAISIPK